MVCSVAVLVAVTVEVMVAEAKVAELVAVRAVVGRVAARAVTAMAASMTREAQLVSARGPLPRQTH